MMPGVRVVAAAVLAAITVGCGPPIGVKRADPRTVHATLTENALSSATPSWSTRNQLFARGLTITYEKNPEKALADWHGLVQTGEATPDDLAALAELSFLYAERTEKRPYALAAALYAWAYLFPPPGTAAPSPYDPRFRMACDLYNRGLTIGFASKDGKEVELDGGAHALPFGTLDVTVDPAGFIWDQRRLVRMIPVAEYQVSGLPTRHRIPGIGAPLAASTEPLDASRPVGDQLVGPRVKVPVTALLRVDDAIRQLATGRVQGTIELHAWGDDRTVEVDGRRVPLESESTATLAAQLAESPLWAREIKGFLQDLGAADQIPRLGAIRPYARGKIPVVFVHGTASSAARWAAMANELDNDPAISRAYQFWFFTYDTGNPIAYSAMSLREALTETVARLDPDGTDPALHDMVVIGHSQGGLLTKTTVVESGDAFWKNVSTTKSLSELQVSPESRDLLERALFLHPLPFVKRVVFIATPHQGSYVAGNRLVHWFTRWIKLPSRLTHLAGDLLTRNRESLAFAATGELPRSVDNMTPGNPFVKTLASLPLAPGVHGHSIVAVQGDGPLADGTDGVVAYQSAHIAGVDSELIVKSAHSCQEQPATIAEVRRILLLHAAAFGHAEAAAEAKEAPPLEAGKPLPKPGGTRGPRR